MSLSGRAQLPLHPERGVVCRIGSEQEIPETLPGPVENLEVAVSWQELEKKEKEYGFQELDGRLEEIAAKGWKAFVRITTGRHPEYLFRKVPYMKREAWEEHESRATGSGIPMFWHPTYRERYAALLYNLGLHLRRSEAGDRVLGIVPDVAFLLSDEMPSFIELARDSSNWILPEGSDPVDVDWWSEGTWSGQMEYLHEVHRRAGSGAGWMYRHHNGLLPDNPYELKMAEIFMDQCRGGKAFGYAWTGKKPEGTEVTEPQFLHWNMLYNLQAGASFLSVPDAYMQDTTHREDYAFFQKYAGFISKPDTAPGIWIAFREGERVEGDFAFGMERNRAIPSTPLAQTGPGKYGLWGRKAGSMSTIRLKMDKEFLDSLHPKLRITIRVWYLDDDRSVFRIHAFDGIHPIQKTGTGRWKVAEISRRPLIKTRILDLVALDGPLTVHMVEVARYGY